MTNTAKQIINKYCVQYFVDQVRSGLLTKEQGEKELREILKEITSENSSEAPLEEKVGAYFDYILKSLHGVVWVYFILQLQLFFVIQGV